MSPELQQFRAEALEEINRIKDIAESVCDKLKEGCPLATAYEIVDNVWLPTQATEIKTRLSSEFPERNASVIKGETLSTAVSLLMSVPKSIEFFDKAFPEIIIRVNEIYKEINDLGLNDTLAIDKYNAFRKEPARFADYVKDLWYPESLGLQNGTITTWQEVSRESVSVENGDYLLMVDYGECIRKARKNLDVSLIDSLADGDVSLNSITWRLDQLYGMVRLIGMFMVYLGAFQVPH